MKVIQLQEQILDNSLLRNDISSTLLSYIEDGEEV